MDIEIEDIEKLILFEFKKKANGMSGVPISILELRRNVNATIAPSKFSNLPQIEKGLCDKNYIELVPEDEGNSPLGQIPSYCLTEDGAKYIRTIM